ncbi:uncharacterized protein LOC110188010 [Drosophila serrata]|uniref:uncharacterized protein LOC110188010 n=1 Tax=Drosophila serrata TaxID=7274 RepID=UPI000A1CFF43|nr:uncharacterized protein LOC110188010 [Drosophila serrata]XP_020813193.1 uncharacterized protein LOC110188010 [Drosophila serrata]KAH8374516.1 hypothetical protein KR200_000251 [Drosophila serrata]
MKPFSLTTCIRQIWIMSGWLRQEAAVAASMLVLQRHQAEQKEEAALKDQKRAAAEGEEVGQVGVDAQGRLRRVRILDDYIMPFECSI